MPKTSKKDFELFKNECQKWIEVFGLKGWNITYEHNDRTEDCQASCISHTTNRYAILRLKIKWDEMWEITDLKIRQAAFHEVMEVFLTIIDGLARYRYTTDLEIEEEIHNIIRTLENVVFK